MSHIANIELLDEAAELADILHDEKVYSLLEKLIRDNDLEELAYMVTVWRAEVNEL